ncbi:type II toxin-antitoxin system VapC family toxin [Hymenobacter psoromatis]|uniref:type II toxin-antitoxin system VapC family toxin n=1 Tax=Hymenobacter psoromatis TaxID=1484116 RepID=UPI001CBD4F9E|nr:PIN domain-containing protein [Hymenobacter psoromatis]
MRHLFLDTNVLLDFILQRDGFGPAARQLFITAEAEEVVLYAAALSFSHIYYTLRKTNPPAERILALKNLASAVNVIPLTRPVIEAALALGFADFEDGLQYCAARAVSAIEAIVTRDAKGFAAGTLPILTPPQALARLI